MKIKSKTRKLALSAVLCALGVVILYLGSIITVLDLTGVAASSLIIYFIVIELSGAYPYLVYAATSVLALLLLPNKFCGLVYFLFGGVYPIFKEMFERLHPVVSWILKFSVFNTGLLLFISAAVFIFKLPDMDNIGFNIATFFIGNLTFWLYDIASSKLILLYLIKFRRKFGMKNYFD